MAGGPLVRRDNAKVTDSPKNTNNDASVATGPPSEEFVQLFSRSQRRIYLFILAQVANPVDAEEILQETNVVIWSKFHKFQLGTNFNAWACQIATYEVLKFRERRRRDRLYFSDEFVKSVAADALSNFDSLEDRRNALIQCLGKLNIIVIP